MTLEEMIKVAQMIADYKHNGHLTILKFSTHWKAMFDTPDLILGWNPCQDKTPTGGWKQIRDLNGYPTIDLAFMALIRTESEAMEELFKNINCKSSSQIAP